MKIGNVAKAYARSVIELGKSENVNVAQELTALTEVINESNDLETVLFLDLFTIDEKAAVINEVLTKVGSSSLVKNFLLFLNPEKRLGLFPLIFKDVIVIDDHARGFLRGTIEGSEDQANDEFVNKVVTYLKKELNKEIQLDYKKTDKLSAGYRVTVEDLQLDASLDNQLQEFKNSVLNS